MLREARRPDMPELPVRDDSPARGIVNAVLISVLGFWIPVAVVIAHFR